jgi:hypothetical protein
MGDEEAIVYLAFAVHAVRHPSLTHECGKAMLEYAGTDPAEHIFAAVLLENDGVDTLQVQQLRKQQAGWAASDDSYLGPHRLSPLRLIGPFALLFDAWRKNLIGRLEASTGSCFHRRVRILRASADIGLDGNPRELALLPSVRDRLARTSVGIAAAATVGPAGRIRVFVAAASAAQGRADALAGR